MKWVSKHLYKILFCFFLFIFGTFFYLTGSFSSYTNYTKRGEKYLKTLNKRLEKKPYDSSRLLEAARLHYKLVRDKVRSGRDPKSFEPILKQGLSYYRRLISNSEWEISRKDYFFAGYLYYYLGDSYYTRARAMALKAYEKGYRSRRLISLLGNVNYFLATSKDDYRTALNYYRSLGGDIRDPVLLLNMVKTLIKLENSEEALQKLNKGKKFLKAYEDDQTLRRKYRVAEVRVKIKQSKFSEALSFIDTIPENRRSLNLRTLYARCLIELGRTRQARKELEEIVQHKSPPQEAKVLLNDISGSSTKARS